MRCISSVVNISVSDLPSGNIIACCTFFWFSRLSISLITTSPQTTSTALSTSFAPGIESMNVAGAKWYVPTMYDGFSMFLCEILYNSWALAQTIDTNARIREMNNFFMTILIIYVAKIIKINNKYIQKRIANIKKA